MSARIGILLLLLAGATTQAADFAADAPERLAAYLRVDTTNPPGNESAGVAFLAEILDRAGIAYRTAESAPGRGNLWARLEGPGIAAPHRRGGRRPALLGRGPHGR
jgi:acetylornithine deacetylase/succinyl-diaminopimelate desuccinylase-like protein